MRFKPMLEKAANQIAAPLSASSKRSAVRAGAAVALAGIVTACQPVTLGGPGYSTRPTPGVNPPVIAQPTGEVLGSGSVRVALLTPSSAPGQFGKAGQSIRNAAAMALQDYSSADLQVIVKDVGQDQAALQASKALAEGAQLVIGPMRSAQVKTAGTVLKPAGVPMLAFTTDTGVAARGVYLINFTPENDVDRMISYAASKGKRSIAAMLPATPYGSVVEASLRQTAARNGVRILAIEKYKSGGKADPFSLQTAAEKLGEIKNQIDAMYIPEGVAAVPATQLLAGQGIRANKIQFLGSGQWDNASVSREPMLRGAWYPAPPASLRNLDGRTIGFDVFANRYTQQYGERPPRVAALAYDAVILSAALVAQAGERRFAHETLTDPQGFIGFGDGFFRFRPDGTSQRSLGIKEITTSGAKLIENAPMSAAGLPN
ncbi:penicillin-binding protein activator [Cohaesibacter gelatinilyticus]|uniref:Amino acid/amide ABC transporter substrate-binding protein, HAAT family n=1 Tax=Cohaesibacter gelatinilyticus TaxID=372072 RepID=A0A285PDZ6_9HYPH|nr:penicillin-binding protein activator [Cohaesibacter gelatinilyticus]SNZ19949.1 amino acid/amide ABC transporter substrate-binding protein, HAAT family [Cohaesibacter gelatinilyticus]